MNILYLCDEYPPGQHGGIGTSVRLLARAMVKLGHNVIVAGLYSPGYGGEDYYEDEGVKVYRFRAIFYNNWAGDQQSIAVQITNRILKYTGLMDCNIKRSLSAYKIHLEKLVADHYIDIVEMPDYNDYTRFCSSYISFPTLSVPVIVKLHGSLTYFGKEAGKPVAAHIFKIEQAILNQAAAISSVSKYTANRSAVYFSYSKEIKVLYNGINTKAEANLPVKTPNQVVFTGSLVKRKGLFQLLKAWNKVNELVPQAILIILGKGPQRKALVNLDKKARSSVKFMGHVTNERLFGYLMKSCVSVFPSYTESFSLAPMEAMTCGTAVVISNRCAGPELIDDKQNGLLINPDDTDQITSAILFLLNNENECERLAQNGKTKVDKYFDIETIAAKNLAFYSKVVNGQ